VPPRRDSERDTGSAISRREAFRLAGRAAAAAAIAAGAAALGYHAISAGEDCKRGGYCRGCPEVARCDLEPAVKARNGGGPSR
jgi:hypothetical protein